MSREHKRKAIKEVRSIAERAKRSMASWMAELDYVPSIQEIRAWQAGYVAGINKDIKD